MSRTVLYLAFLFVCSFSFVDGAVAAEEGKLGGSLVRLDHSADDENANSIELDDCGLGVCTLALQPFGTIAFVNTLSSICSYGRTSLQSIRAPPVLLI